MSPFEFDAGFRLSVDTYLSDTAGQFRERRIEWFHDHYNQVHVRYELDIELLVCICIVDEQWVFFEAADVEMSEWNGTDGKWHTLGIEIVADQLTVFRDEDIIFQHTDSLLRNMPRTGFIQLSNKSARTCFDDVLLVSIEDDDFLCGDADASGAVDIDDVVFLIAYIFAAGPEPAPYESGDADCSQWIDIDDVVCLIGYIFSGGMPPCDVDGDGIPDC